MSRLAQILRARATSAVLTIAIAGAGVFAVIHSRSSDAAPPAPREPDIQDTFARAELPSVANTLPPNHPSIAGGGSPHGSPAPASEEVAAMTWRVPDAWQTLPNPSSMRIATYRVGSDAEMSVTRAGGSIDANVQRWLGQFDDAGRDTRTEKTVRGLHVTVIEVSGTYMGGSMGGANAAPRPDFTLLAAIVETNGSSYFFKVTGPTATVQAAHAAFAALIDSVTPA